MYSFLIVIASLGGASRAHALTDCSSRYKALQDAKDAPAADRKQKAEKVLECERARLSSLDKCPEVKSDFNKIVRELTDKCQEFKIESDKDPGGIACSNNYEKQCSCLDESTKALDRQKTDFCQGVTEQTHPQCPQRSEKQAERDDKRLADAEARRDKLSDKVDRLEDESDKGENTAADKAREARANLRKAEQDHTQAINEAKSSFSSAQAALYQQVNALQEKIYQAQQGVTDAQLKDSTAFVSWQEQDLKIELNCTTQATQAVSGMQAEAIAAFKTGTYNRGDQNSIFRQVGLTDRESWQKQAALRKRWCMDSELTHGSKTSNQRAYQETLRANAAARDQAQKQVAMLQGQMTQLQNPSGCGATTPNGVLIQTQACRDADEMKRKTASADEALAAARDDAKKDDAASKIAIDKSKGKKGAQIGKAKAELNEAEEQVKMMKAKRDASQSYPYAGPREPQARSLAADVDRLVNQVGAVNRCCEMQKSDSTAYDGSECTSARNYLKTHGYHFDLQPESTPPSRPTTTPGSPQAPTRPAGTGV